MSKITINFNRSNGERSFFIDGKPVSEEKMLEHEFNRITRLIEAAKRGNYEAAEELLFQTINYFNENSKDNTKIVKLLQNYIGECLYSCITKPLLETPNEPNNFFANMNDARRGTALCKAFFLNRPSSIRRSNYFRDYRLAYDYFSLIKAKKCQFNCKKDLVIQCLCSQYGLKNRQIKNIIKDKKLEQCVKNDIKEDYQHADNIKRTHIFSLPTWSQIEEMENLPENAEEYEKVKNGYSKIEELLVSNADLKLIFDAAFDVSLAIIFYNSNIKSITKLIGITLYIAKQAVLMRYFNYDSYRVEWLTNQSINYYKEIKNQL